MKITLILISFLLFNGCRDNSELSMERGEYYYSVNRLEDAVLEYTKVINSYRTHYHQLLFNDFLSCGIRGSNYF